MIFLTFLKFIGKLLLIILAIIIFLLCLILFYPVEYKTKGRIKEADVDVTIKVSWLFHLLGADLDYNEHKVNTYYRILFFRRPFEKKDSEELSEAEDLVNETVSNASLYIASVEDSEEENVNEYFADEDQRMENSNSKNSNNKNSNNKNSDNKHSDNKNSDNKNSNNKEDSSQNVTSKISLSQRIDNIKVKFNEKRKQLISISKNAEKMKAKATGFLNDSRNQKAIKHLKKELFYFLKIVCPRKMKLTLTFSVGDPAYTGILLGVLAMFPIGYQNKWNISPDFESEKLYADGEFDVTGRIFVYKLLFIIIRLFLDKECRRMYNKYIK